jgi:deoxyribodipyrimidine photolyase-related protein
LRQANGLPQASQSFSGKFALATALPLVLRTRTSPSSQPNWRSVRITLTGKDQMDKHRKTLRFVLGDQLSLNLTALAHADQENDIIFMAEVGEETTYAPHHKKKIAFVLAAMRAFAQGLRDQGFKVDYVQLDDPANTNSFDGELERALKRHNPEQIVMTQASEWRVLEIQRAWCERFDVQTQLLPDERFICSLPEFRAWAEGRKTFLMEHFYREMRRKTGLLMDGDEPVCGRWNFDAENRKPAKPDLFMQAPPSFAPSKITQGVLWLVQERFSDNIGHLEPFWFATTQQDAEVACAHFMSHCLPRFGETQDAMLTGQPFLNHAVLSLYINIGLLDPLEVCRKAEAEWRAGRAPIEAVEGFIRQILGWREYVRGIYWLNMPGYTQLNHLDAQRPLPSFYWTGQTRMACMAAAIGQTLEEGYAHHIQRLMVTGNFALLAGLDPHEVHLWYLGVYVDAYEWVEAPNTIGMALYADAGIMATKPYAASGAYINRMSDYCSSCAYDPKLKTGPRACPFNTLYWDFVGRNEASLGRNPRMGPVFATWRKMDEARKQEIALDARRVLAAMAADTL